MPNKPLVSVIVPAYNAEQTLEKCIGGLPELYRAIARMRLLDGLQYKEIAEETGIELNTVRTRIRRAKVLIDKIQSGEEE